MNVWWPISELQAVLYVYICYDSMLDIIGLERIVQYVINITTKFAFLCFQYSTAWTQLFVKEDDYYSIIKQCRLSLLSKIELIWSRYCITKQSYIWQVFYKINPNIWLNNQSEIYQMKLREWEDLSLTAY